MKKNTVENVNNIVKPDFTKQSNKRVLINTDNDTTDNNKDTEIIEDYQTNAIIEEDARDAEHKKKVNNKVKKIVKIVCPIVGTIIVVLIALSIIKKQTADSSKHITKVDVSKYISTEIDKDDYADSHDKNDETKPSSDNNDEYIDTSSKDKPLQSEKYQKTDLVINTKVSSEEGYKDYNTYYLVGNVNITSGYDNIINDIKYYNENSNKVINIGTKDEFYTKNSGNEIYMITVESKLDNNYPTYMNSGVIYDIPNVKLNIFGTKQIDAFDDNENFEKYILTDDTYYKIPDLTKITVNKTTEKDDGYNSKTVFTYKWIVILPSGTTNDQFRIEITSQFNDKTTVIYAE